MTADELAALRQFIISRSARFAEPAILLEIMDHFACKTEEILQAEPGLSLDMAMKKAHHAFGVKGFAPLAEACEKAIFSRYRHWYRQELRNVWCSLHVLGFGLLGLLAAQLCLLAEKLAWLGEHGIYLILFVEFVYAICLYPILVKAGYGKKHRIFYNKALSISNGRLSWLRIGSMLIIITDSDRLAPWMVAATVGLLTFSLGLNLRILFQLLRKADRDADTTEAQLASLG